MAIPSNSVFTDSCIQLLTVYNFSQYHGLLSAVPSVWKKDLKQEEQAATVNLLAIVKLTYKTIYRSLIDQQNLSPPTAEKKLIECGFDIHDRQKIYSLPFLVTKEIKLTILQYKIIHNFLYIICILYKMKKKVENPHCPFLYKR